MYKSHRGLLIMLFPILLVWFVDIHYGSAEEKFLI